MIMFAVTEHLEDRFSFLLWAYWNSSDTAEPNLFLLTAMKLWKHPDRSAMWDHQVESFDSSTASVKFCKFCTKRCSSLLNLFFILGESPHYVLFMQSIINKVDALEIVLNEFVFRHSLWNELRNLVPLRILDFVFLILAEHVINFEWGLSHSFAQTRACHHSSQIWGTFYNDSVELASHNLLELSQVFLVEQFSESCRRLAAFRRYNWIVVGPVMLKALNKCFVDPLPMTHQEHNSFRRLWWFHYWNVK